MAYRQYALLDVAVSADFVTTDWGRRRMSRIIERLYEVACRKSWWVNQHFNYRVTRLLGTRSVVIPIRAGLGLRNLDFRINELNHVLHTCVRLGHRGFFVDIGANTGQSLLALLASDITASYLGFEPDVDAAAYLADLIRTNQLLDAYILPIALGSSEGNAIMHTSARAFAGATLSTDMTPQSMYSRQTRVTQSTGDIQMSHIPKDSILLIKIDVEGHELSVLNGSRDTLMSAGPPVYVEVLGFDHFQNGSYSREYFGTLTRQEIDRLVESRSENGKAVERLLHECGYRLWMFDSSGALSPIDHIDLASSRPGSQGERNILALQESKSRPVKPYCNHPTRSATFEFG